MVKSPQIPVLDAVEGIKFDFNHGIRILFPHNSKTYHVTFLDIDMGIILYSNDTVPGAFVTSVKKFYTFLGIKTSSAGMPSTVSLETVLPSLGESGNRAGL